MPAATEGKVQYKKIRGLAGSLFAAAPTPEEETRFALSADPVRFYQENGYLPNVPLLSPPQLSALRERLEAMIREDFPRQDELIGQAARAGGLSKVQHGRQQMIYFQGAWLVDEAFHDVVFAPAVTVKVRQLLGAWRARFWHDQVFYKPARHGGVVAWHQDFSYWTRTEPPGHLTCFVGLDDSTLANGCVHMVPGSHRWGLLPRPKDLLDEMEALKTVLSPEQKAAFKPVPIQLKAGECSFHHCFTVHGSYPNNSDVPRRGLVLNYMAPDTRCCDDSKPPMPGAPIVAKGAVIEGEDFPLV